MKFKVLLAAAATLMGLSVCCTVASAATEVQVTKPAFHVSVNGRYVDNDYRQYPFIVYNDITYFPMTYNDCAFLGVRNDWTPETGTVITTTASNGIYDEMITAVYNVDYSYYSDEHYFYATVAEGAISVNGTAINNATQQYPILTFRDVPYFPLTWDWCQAFGWSSLFNDAGLSVCSPEYSSLLGKVNYFTSSGETYTGSMTIIDNLRGGSYSLASTFFKTDPEVPGYITVHDISSMMYIRSDMLDYFNSQGWYSNNQFYELAQSNMSSHSMSEIVLFFESFLQSPDDNESRRAYEIITMLCNDYISVWSYDQSRAMCVPKSKVNEYRSAAWFTYDDLALIKINNLAATGDYALAVFLCSTILDGNVDIDDYGMMTDEIRFMLNDLPVIYPDDLDPSYRNQYRHLARTFADASNDAGGHLVAIPNFGAFLSGDSSGALLASVDFYSPQFRISFINMGYSDITRLDVTASTYDWNGKLMSNNSAYYFSAYEETNTPIKPTTAYTLTWRCSEDIMKVVLKSVKVTFANGQTETYYY